MMNKIKWGLNSYGTLYGTVRRYDTDGNDIGTLDINGYSVFFVVRDKFGYNNNQTIFKKSVGSGITIGTGSMGLFTMTIQSQDVNKNPSEYAYECFINTSGGTFVDGTTQLKSVGSGIFEILKGVKYGTV
jgi:hypothetical protein